MARHMIIPKYVNFMHIMQMHDYHSQATDFDHEMPVTEPTQNVYYWTLFEDSSIQFTYSQPTSLWSV
jgi:hypothetical protein